MDRHAFKAARIARKISQGNLAKTVGLSPSDISRIECGYRDIRPEEAAAIAAALGLVSGVAPAPVAEAANAASKPATAVAPTPALAAIPPAMAASTVGSNLDDPVNFTELPDLGMLEPGALSPAVYRQRLVSALARTTKILHTSRVRAAVWREWRQFERKIHSLLQAG